MNKATQDKPIETTQSVILLNFGDSPRVLYSLKGRPVTVPVGAAMTIELRTATLEKLKARDKTLFALPADIAEQATGPFMQRVLAALRDFDTLDYQRALRISYLTLGVDAFDSPRPTKTEMRLALARRAKEAAHFIMNGASEVADKLLGSERDEKEIEIALKPSTEGPGLVTSDVAQGDSEDEDHVTAAPVSFFKRPDDYVETTDGDDADRADNKSNATGNQAINADLVGVSGANGGGNNEGNGHAGSAPPVSGETERPPRPVAGKTGQGAERPPRPVKAD